MAACIETGEDRGEAVENPETMVPDDELQLLKVGTRDPV
jgi:hypothetical protein